MVILGTHNIFWYVVRKNKQMLVKYINYIFLIQMLI